MKCETEEMVKSKTKENMIKQSRTCEHYVTPPGEGQEPKLRHASKFKLGGAAQIKGAKMKINHEKGGRGTPNKIDIRKYLVKRDIKKIEVLEAKFPLKKGNLLKVVNTEVQSDTDRGGEEWTGSHRGH